MPITGADLWHAAAWFLGIAATTIISGVIGYFIKYTLDRRYAAEPDVRLFKYIPHPDSGGINREFYEFFIEKIRKAKYNIYITGEGFQHVEPGSLDIIENYKSALRQAMRNGATVLRIQNSEPISSAWANALKELLAADRERFRLYIVGKNEGDVARASLGAISFCAIDVDAGAAPVVEIMISAKHFAGAVKTKVAGNALFLLRNNVILAETLRDFTIELTKLGERVAGPELIERLVPMERLYFAFGSNMDRNQMLDRAPSSEFVGIGHIPDYKIDFRRRGSYRQGGVSTITYSPGDTVFGVIWKLDLQELNELDRIEDIKSGAYHREEMKVIQDGGRDLMCQVYIAQPEVNFIAPDQDYIDLMIKGASRSGLPQSYIAVLQSYKVKAAQRGMTG